MTTTGGIPYAKRIGLYASTTSQLLDAIESGVTFRALANLMKSMQLNPKQMARLVDISERTLARRKIEGRLKREESERLLRISRIFEKAANLFDGDEEAATRWLQSPARALGEKQPLEYLTSEIGSREVEDLIGRLEYGVFS